MVSGAELSRLLARCIRTSWPPAKWTAGMQTEAQSPALEAKMKAFNPLWATLGPLVL